MPIPRSAAAGMPSETARSYFPLKESITVIAGTVAGGASVPALSGYAVEYTGAAAPALMSFPARNQLIAGCSADRYWPAKGRLVLTRYAAIGFLQLLIIHVVRNAPPGTGRQRATTATPVGGPGGR